MKKNWKMIVDWEERHPIFIADAETENHPQGYLHICNVNPNLGAESYENAILIAAAPEQAARIAALEADKAKLIDLLQKYQDGYYTDGVIGLTAAFDEAVGRVLAEVAK